MSTPFTHDSDKRLKASVIIPSYNRLEILQKVLVSLEEQSVGKDLFEVIVSDDGSTDNTAAFLKEYSVQTTLIFRYVLAEKNGGPAKARNRALEKATDDIVIIIGDDIEVEKNFIEEHLRWHKMHPSVNQSVLGHVTWPKDLVANSFMIWLENGGRAYFFPYKDFVSGQQIDCRHFYTCNLSIKKEFLFQTSLFDESFPYASHEDIELGERLCRNGMKLYYDADLKGYHWHFLHVNSIARRVYLMGYSAPIYWRKVVDHSGTVKRVLRKILSYIASYSLWWKLLGVLLANKDLDNCHHGKIRWKLIMILSYWIGFSDGVRQVPIKIFPVFTK